MGTDKDFDVTALDVSIQECAGCNEPVSGVVAADGTVAVTCTYCGREDLLTSTRGRKDRDEDAHESSEGASAYRGKARSAAGRATPLVLDLGKTPPEFKGRDGKEAVRKAWLEAKRAPRAEDADRGDHDYKLTWLAATSSGWNVRAKEAVRARAVLESALDLVETPAYRALLLARLVRLAASAKATPLGRAWLARVPRRRHAPEVKTDLLVAEAFLAREESGPRAVLDLLGHGDAVDSFSGPLRMLAVALRTDAHEKLGEHALALANWSAGARAGGATLGTYAGLYGLAPETRKRALRRGYVAIVTLVAAFWALFSFARGVLNGGEVSLFPVAVIAVALVVAVYMKVSRR
jgi:hypothetical protein